MTTPRSFSLARITSLAAALFALAPIACSHSEEPPRPPATEDHAPIASTAQDRAVAQAVSESDRGGVRFSADIKKLCPGLQEPEFSFDSAVVAASWGNALSGLATCMNGGGLVGRRLVLTGHTDPRGDDDYNMALGGRRAESVKHAVASFGVDEGRMDTTSRGEADARGTDEASWQLDRRVDIDLAR
jgi:peptidoglycan-associated lipoprotein